MSTPGTFSSSPTRELNLGLLFMRLACSLPFLYHGSAILFGAFGGPGPAGFATFMKMPVVVGYLVGLAQFAGGIAILTGALIRVGAICIIIVMLGAIFLVHLPNGFDINHGGIEFALSQTLIAIGLLLSGAGKYSLGNVLPTPLRKL